LNILLHDFLESVSINKIDIHIQKVCEIAEVNEEVEGYFVNEDTRVKELVKLAKHNFIISHCSRRSFAANYYGIVATTILM